MRLIESTTIEGKSGERYAMNIYPSDMVFNDFIPGVFLLYAGDEVLFLGDSDNVDIWLRKNEVVTKLGDQGFSKIGFIRQGNPGKRAGIVSDLAGALEVRLSEIA